MGVLGEEAGCAKVLGQVEQFGRVGGAGRRLMWTFTGWTGADRGDAEPPPHTFTHRGERVVLGAWSLLGGLLGGQP